MFPMYPLSTSRRMVSRSIQILRSAFTPLPSFFTLRIHCAIGTPPRAQLRQHPRQRCPCCHLCARPAVGQAERPWCRQDIDADHLSSFSPALVPPSSRYDVWSFVIPKVSITASKPRNRTTDMGLLTFSGKAYVGVLLQPGHPLLEIWATVLDSATVSNHTLVVVE